MADSRILEASSEDTFDTGRTGALAQDFAGENRPGVLTLVDSASVTGTGTGAGALAGDGGTGLAGTLAGEGWVTVTKIVWSLRPTWWTPVPFGMRPDAEELGERTVDTLCGCWGCGRRRGDRSNAEGNKE